MENSPPIDDDSPRQEALEDAAFTVWQFAASFSGLPLGESIEQIRPPEADDWIHAANLTREFQLSPDELKSEARLFFNETLEELYPDGELEFFQKTLRQAIRTNKMRKANFAIKGAVERRIFMHRR